MYNWLNVMKTLISVVVTLMSIIEQSSSFLNININLDIINCRHFVENSKRKNDFLSIRFNDKKLDLMCSKRNQWQENIKKPRPINILTQAQVQYINDLKTCKGKQCFEINHVKLAMKTDRKEYRSLTDDERNKFHAALKALKAETVDGVSKYDLLIRDHSPSLSPGAHFGCAFVPWHREYLKQVEVALRREVNDSFIPYWDSTLDEGLPNPCDSILWSDTFMGNSNGPVTSGPFANWSTTEPFPGTNDYRLYRDCNRDPDGDLFQPVDVDYVLTRNVFQNIFCYCNEPTFETQHSLVHVFVGGHMSDIGLSANDPLFFMHHAFIDYLWEQWRLKKQTREQREKDYPSDNITCGENYNLNASMKPYSGLTVKDGLSNSYTDELYTYSSRPTCPDNCTSPYLFCSTRFNPFRCLSKIKFGGNCQFYNGEDVCYKGNCVKGRCV